MNSFKTKTFSKAFCSIAAIGMLMASCSKNDSDVVDVDCLAHLNPDTLRFVVLGKESGADLFFSDSPVYDTTELKLFRKGAGSALEPAHQGIAENRGNIHFFSYVYPAPTPFSCR